MSEMRSEDISDDDVLSDEAIQLRGRRFALPWGI